MSDKVEFMEKALSSKERVEEQKDGNEFVSAEVVVADAQRDKSKDELALQKMAGEVAGYVGREGRPLWSC